MKTEQNMTGFTSFLVVIILTSAPIKTFLPFHSTYVDVNTLD